MRLVWMTDDNREFLVCTDKDIKHWSTSHPWAWPKELARFVMRQLGSCRIAEEEKRHVEKVH